jgi:hypothetical protein
LGILLESQKMQSLYLYHMSMFIDRDFEGLMTSLEETFYDC